ncbi:MAG: hypothetical protein ACI39R_03510 [Lachnospiraceae bacterium]
MDDKELKKLKKSELLEILLYMRKEIDSLKEENRQLTEKIEKMDTSSLNDEILSLAKSNSEKLDMFCAWLMADDKNNR